jgi:pimeloyl-ACP methyl ester carboxylesterase
MMGMDAALFHEPRRRAFKLADGEMAAIEFGDPNRPVDVVFTHANGFNAMTYRSILAPVSASLRILAIDQRGHGASQLPAVTEGRRSWHDLQGDLAAVLDQIGGPPVVLAGHSMGATASLMAAAIRPQRVSKLVLFDPVVMDFWLAFYALAPWTSGQKWKDLPIAKRAAARRSIFPSFADAFGAYKGKGAFKSWPDTILADYIAAGFRTREDGQVELSCSPAWEASNFTAQANGLWSVAGRIKAPITIFRAEHASTCRIGSGRFFLRAHPGSSVTTVPGTSHFLPMERPDLVRDALLDATDHG